MIEAIEELDIQIEKVIYGSPNGFTVIAATSVRQPSERFTVTGRFATIKRGASLHVQGYWSLHTKYGKQFTVQKYQELRPSSAATMAAYLSSGLVPGIGEAMAQRIVETFGEETYDVLDTRAHLLLQVPGIGKKRLSDIERAWQEQRALHQVMGLLQEHGVTLNTAVKICLTYGADAYTICTTTPYRLARDIRGVGFLAADKLAMRLGMNPLAPARLQAGLLHALWEATQEGHCYLPQSRCLAQSQRLLTVDENAPPAVHLLAQLNDLLEDGSVIQCLAPDGELWWSTPYWTGMEQETAQRLLALSGTDFPISHWDQRLRWWLNSMQQQAGDVLDSQQTRAVLLAMSAHVSVMTGGPGTGKTFSIRSLVAFAKENDWQVKLLAPTGRAAQRMKEMTGEPAETVHRALGLFPGSEQGTVISERLVIVDEVSMVDLPLMRAIVMALRPGSHLVLVGDADQLPSVGPGAVLQDLIASGSVPVTRLSHVYRQADTSSIPLVAQEVKEGRVHSIPGWNSQRLQETQIIEVADGEMLGKVVRGLSRYLDAAGFSLLNDVQFLSFQRRGIFGIGSLNAMLQEIAHPDAQDGPSVDTPGGHILVGDRVMQTINSYEKGVFNGDLGVVTVIDAEKTVTVRFGETEVTYTRVEQDMLDLAWAMTVHKSQGSEFPVVVIAVAMEAYHMLDRSLIYTALTRAKQHVIFVGQRKALLISAGRIPSRQRYTRLAERLRE